MLAEEELDVAVVEECLACYLLVVAAVDVDLGFASAFVVAVVVAGSSVVQAGRDIADAEEVLVLVEIDVGSHDLEVADH